MIGLQPRIGVSASLVIARLDANEGGEFASFTYPAFAPLLIGGSHPNILAWGARIAGEPVGLVLGRIDEDGEAMLASLFTVPARRGQAIGRRLALALLDALRSLGARAVVARVAGANPSRPALQRALVAAGMPPLACTESRIVGLAGAMAREGGTWKGVRHLVEQGDVVGQPIGDMPDDAREALAAFAGEQGFPGSVDRIRTGLGIQPALSIGLRTRAGRPVGWLLGVLSEPLLAGYDDSQAVWYSQAYMVPDRRRSAAMVGAFWQAFTRQAELFGPRSLAGYHTAAPAMVELSRRRFAPMALRAEEVFATRLVLSPDAAG